MALLDAPAIIAFSSLEHRWSDEMNRSGRSSWRALGCAAVLGAAIAFPLGLFVGAGDAPRDERGPPMRPTTPPDRVPAARDLYSPRVISDPYVIEQQRRVARALAASCRRSGRHCAEAEQARRRIEEAEGGR
jgi:hypothetical protein